MRALTRAVPLLVLLGWGASASPTRRPPVDRSAMREAISASAREEDFASPTSYAHFLQARLLHHSGNHRGAVDELRLSLASDDGNPHLLTRLAEEYARLGDLKRAERELKQVVERFPAYYPARLLMGRVLLEAGKSARARLQLRRAIQLRPREPEPYLVLAQLHLEARAPDLAVKVVEELAVALPGEASGYRRLGLALAERGDAARAEPLLARATERDPGDMEVWLALARLREQAGRLAEAEEALSRALMRDADNQAVLMGAGQLALRQGSVVRARAYFDRLLALSGDPELTVKVAFAFLSANEATAAGEVLDAARKGRDVSPRISYYAGLVHERMRHFQEAAASYAQVPVASDVFAEARRRRANCLSLVGDHAGALVLLRAALTEEPSDVEARTLQARVLERSGTPERAVATLEEALARGADPGLYEALAATHQRQGRPAQAVALLRDAVARHPKDASLRYALASALQGQGDVEGALALMRSVLEREPDHAAAMNFIGYLLAERGRELDEAERLVRRALELRPDTGSFLDSLGWILFQRGDYPRAVEVLQKAAALEPEEPVILEHLGDAYHRLSRPEEAARAWRGALEVLAQSPEAAEPPEQRAILERKLKKLSTGAADR